MTYKTSTIFEFRASVRKNRTENVRQMVRASRLAIRAIHSSARLARSASASLTVVGVSLANRRARLASALRASVSLFAAHWSLSWRDREFDSGR